MKRKKATSRRVTIDPDQAYRIRWRGTYLAPHCYRGFCSKCGRHMIEPTEPLARRMDLVCEYCFTGTPEDVAGAVAEILRDSAKRSTGSSGPHDDESPWQSNAIREMEDGA